MKRRLAAILVADVVGYSGMVQRDEIGAVQMVKGHIAAFEPHLALHNGRIIKKLGDGFLADFTSVVEAVACAVELQKVALERNQHLEAADRATFRIGVHSGDVIEDDNDIFGDGVIIASRLESIATPGSIAISAKVFEEVDGRLDLEFRDLGLKTLKDIERPVKVFEIEVGAAAVPRWPRPDLPDKPSIAVLPLQTFSDSIDDEFFADGLTEDLTTALAGVPWLFVIARNSTFTYRGLAVDLLRISQDLGVRYVVEGSVRRSGGRIRISAHLVEATSGKHIWGDRFDGQLEDVFDLQDRIVDATVRAVAPQIQLAEIRQSARKRPVDHTSYDFYLHALNQLNCAKLSEAENLLQKAIEVYPDYASAKAILAWCTTLRIAWQSGSEYEPLREKAIGLCDEALKSPQRDIETDAYAGYSLAFHTCDTERGMELVAGAVERCPSFAWAWASRSFLESYFGDPQRALEFGKLAQRLNPRDPLIFRSFHAITTAYIGIGDYQKALDSACEGLKYNGGIFALRLQKVSALVKLRRLSEATSEANYIQKRHPEFRISNFLSYRKSFQSSSLIAECLKEAEIPE